MTTPDPLATLRRRAFRHAFEDGAIDLVLGLFTFMVGAATQRRALLVLVLVYFGLMSTAWKALHQGLTSRRTGYAEVPGDPPRQLLAVVLLAGCLTMAVVAALTLTSGRLWSFDRWPDWTPMVSGLILAIGFLHVAIRTGLGRFHLLAAATVGASLFFWLYPFGPRINPSDRLTLSLFVTAAVLMLTGAVAIARFVRSRPVVPEEAGDGR